MQEPASRKKFGIHPLIQNFWQSWRRDLNPRPSDYKSDALPTELRQHGANQRNITKGYFNCKGTLWKTCAKFDFPAPGAKKEHAPACRCGQFSAHTLTRSSSPCWKNYCT